MCTLLDDCSLTPIAVAHAPSDAENVLCKKRKMPDPDYTLSSLDCDYQKESKGIKEKKDKIHLFIQAVVEAKSKIKAKNMSLGDPLKTWLYRISKVVDCVQECHGGSVEAFSESNTSVPLSKFKTCKSGKEHKACFDIVNI